MANVKVGARIVRAMFVGNQLGLLLFVVFYLGMVVINGVGNTPVMKPEFAGIFGWLAGISASVGVELSKDIDQQS